MGDLCGINSTYDRLSTIQSTGVVTCMLPVEGSFVDVFGVTRDLAYGIGGIADAPLVLKLSGGAWDLRATLPPRGVQTLSIWADRQTVVVAGSDQFAYVASATGGFASLPSVPVGDYQAVWGYGPSDIWFMNTANQLVHYNGAEWQTIETGTGTTGMGVSPRFWGDGSVLYFTTNTGAFGKWNGTKVEVLLGPGVGASGLSGTSSTEIFLSVHDQAFDHYSCGGEFVLWFDGKQFHRF